MSCKLKLLQVSGASFTCQICWSSARVPWFPPLVTPVWMRSRQQWLSKHRFLFDSETFLGGLWNPRIVCYSLTWWCNIFAFCVPPVGRQAISPSWWIVFCVCFTCKRRMLTLFSSGMHWTHYFEGKNILKCHMCVALFCVDNKVLMDRLHLFRVPQKSTKPGPIFWTLISGLCPQQCHISKKSSRSRGIDER